MIIMDKKVKKIERITRYHQQRKNQQVIRLKRASMKRLSIQKSLSAAAVQRGKFSHDCLSSLTGNVSMAEVLYMEGGSRSIRAEIDQIGARLADARKAEEERRRVLADAVTTHRVWEKVLYRNRARTKKREELKQRRITDDMALRKLQSPHGMKGDS